MYIEHDYRITSERLEELGDRLDHLSEHQLMKLSDTLDNFSEYEKKVSIESAKEYFEKAIFPHINYFAMVTSSLLAVHDCDEGNTIIVTLKNICGFDLFDHLKFIRSLLAMSSNIGVTAQDNEAILSLVFDCTSFLYK